MPPLNKIGCREHSDAAGEHTNLFKKAMRHWEERSCLSFVPRQETDKHYILFTIDKCG